MNVGSREQLERSSARFAAALKDHRPAQTMLLNRINDEVTATGMVVKMGGLQMIYIDTVK
jgi:hypothetical protein